MNYVPQINECVSFIPFDSSSIFSYPMQKLNWKWRAYDWLKGVSSGSSSSSNPVSSKETKPASHKQATLGFFDKEPALGAPCPFVVLSKLDEHNVLSFPLILVQFLKVGALYPRMPTHLTLSAEQSPTLGTLGVRNDHIVIDQQQSRAVLERTIEFLGTK